MFYACEEAFGIVLNEFNYQINDDELCYMAMHVGAAMERQKSRNKNRTYKAIVACKNSVGTSKLRTSSIRSEFR